MDNGCIFIEIPQKPILFNITGEILALGGSGGKQLPKPMLTDISATIFRCWATIGLDLPHLIL